MPNPTALKLLAAFPGKRWSITGGSDNFTDFKWLDNSPPPTEEDFAVALAAKMPAPRAEITIADIVAVLSKEQQAALEKGRATKQDVADAAAAVADAALEQP